jgi:hypothetical protein
MPAMAHPHAPQFPWPIPPSRTLRGALVLIALSAFVQIIAAAWGLHRRQTLRSPRPTAVATTLAHPEIAPHEIIDPNSSQKLRPRLNSPTLREPWEEAIERARKAAENRQTDAALRALLEAESTVPERPSALAELAVQYEKCGLPARAIKLWEKIQKLGPSGGVFYDASSAKLSLLTEHALDSLRPAPSASVPKPGLLKFGSFTVVNAPDNSAENRRFTLRVPVTRAEGSQIQATGVVLQVQFFDQINDGAIERTNARVTWEWARNPVDWAASRTQTLQVGYTQTPARSSEKRRFFGYVAGVYYEGKLLDTRSSPARLGTQYPPPRTLPRDPTP